MIFVGDVAVPPGSKLRLKTLPPEFSSSYLVANLEGAIVPKTPGLIRRRVLFNDPSVLTFLSQQSVKVVTIANNHILDVEDSPKTTIRVLNEAGIRTCGAGDSLREAGAVCTYPTGDRAVAFMGFGWKIIECPEARRSAPGVNPLTPENVISAVRSFRAAQASVPLVLLMHWNYEFELYPQPMHRELAFQAIDAGANAVVGCHSHRVQGIEFYRGSPIVHGLGNWMLVQNTFMNGDLRFPDSANLQLAFEWDPATGRSRCHWFDYSSGDQTLTHIVSEETSASARVRELTPYAGFELQEYGTWFRRNRHKRLLLPVYYTTSHRVRNRMKDAWVGWRGRIINFLAMLNLKRRRV